MATRRNPTVVDIDGVRGRIREFVFADDDTSTDVAIVDLKGGVRLSLPADLLHPHDDGGYQITARWAQFLDTADTATVEVPVIHEDVVVGVRPVPGERVRVRRRVVTEEKLVETPFWREHVEVERIPSGVYVDRMPEPRQEGDTLIVPCVEEVIEKRLRVREELRIRVIREQHVDRRTVPLRRHEIQIEREPDVEAAHSGSKTPKKHEGGTS
jgi:stress response protein YsnF